MHKHENNKSATTMIRVRKKETNTSRDNQNESLVFRHLAGENFLVKGLRNKGQLVTLEKLYRRIKLLLKRRLEQLYHLKPWGETSKAHGTYVIEQGDEDARR